MKKQMMNKNINLSNIPSLPWIYQFFDKDWNIIYIWKSLNLKSRVSSYFNSETKLNFAKKKMVSQIQDIKTVITNSWTESILLETNLIKKHKPKYNILMKDDKNHSYIKITKEIIPKVFKTRIKKKDWTYFWPYTMWSYADNSLKIMKKIFWYRSCNIIFWEKNNKIIINSNQNTKIPCIDYYIKRCSWPCLLWEKEINEYLNQIENIKNFLSWNNKEVIENLKNKMIKYAKELNFEKAQETKEIINSIENITQNQIITDIWFENWDIINYIEKYEAFYISKIEIRNNKIYWIYNFELKDEIKEKKEYLKYFLENNYINNKNKLHIVLPEELDIETDFIKELNLIFIFPQIWEKTRLLELVYKNRFEFAYKNHLQKLSVKTFTKKDMLDILTKTWYKKINENIIFECNDISHISWNHTVASRSIIENWKINTSKYKKFKIKTLKKWEINDFDSMREIMQRRILEIKKTWFIPDLIIIDWGKWQLSSVMEIIEKNMEELPILKNLQIISLAKKEEEIFMPYTKEPILLEKDSSNLRIIQKIRDEAHRFAITFNRESRLKEHKKNILEELPWFWPKTRQKLLKEFWNIENIISWERLEKIINKNQIQTLIDHWII